MMIETNNERLTHEFYESRFLNLDWTVRSNQVNREPFIKTVFYNENQVYRKYERTT